MMGVLKNSWADPLQDFFNDQTTIDFGKCDELRIFQHPFKQIKRFGVLQKIFYKNLNIWNITPFFFFDCAMNRSF